MFDKRKKKAKKVESNIERRQGVINGKANKEERKNHRFPLLLLSYKINCTSDYERNMHMLI